MARLAELGLVSGPVPFPADATRVPKPRPAALPALGALLEPPAPPPPVVEPQGGDFQGALRFVLDQELKPSERARPGVALMTTLPETGDAGLDPIAEAEFVRRNPAAAQALRERIDATYVPSQLTDPAARASQHAAAANYNRSIYADIWNASGAGQLPADLGLLHFDTAVNLGPGAAKQLLAESQGNPQRYLALREQRYRDLMDSTTPRGRFQETPADQGGWLGQRMPALRQAMAAIGSRAR